MGQIEFQEHLAKEGEGLMYISRRLVSPMEGAASLYL